MSQKFTSGTLESMNHSYPWNGSITNANSLDKGKNYELHATGDADLNGRKYVALPVGTKLDKYTIEKYNLNYFSR